MFRADKEIQPQVQCFFNSVRCFYVPRFPRKFHIKGNYNTT